MEQEPLEKETVDKLRSRMTQWQGYIEQFGKTVKFTEPEPSPGQAAPSLAVARSVSPPAAMNGGTTAEGTPPSAASNRVLGGYEAHKSARQVSGADAIPRAAGQVAAGAD